MRADKTRKRNGLILLMMLAAVWLLWPVRPLRAEETGSIEIQFGAEAAGIEMTLYPVATYTDGSFVYDGVFAGCGVSLEGLDDAQAAQNAAEQLAALAKERNAEGSSGNADADGVLRYGGLRPAWYLLVQTGGLEALNVQKTLVPVPYTSADGALHYDAVVSPKYSVPDGAVILRKEDDDGAAVADAVFRLEKKVYVAETGELPEGAETGQDVGGRFFWEEVQTGLTTNANGQLAVKNLPFGTYRFVETMAPEGFVLTSAPQYFAVEQAGEVEEADGEYTVVSGEAAEVTAVNHQTTVVVNKVDRDGNPVAGAQLVVKASDGTVVRDADNGALFSFVTGEEPYELKRIPDGTYLLSEVNAPAGYRVSQDEMFTVDSSEDAAIEVTMVDETEEPTQASLRVTKRLVDEQGWNLTAQEAVFYVALFDNQERTNRVTNVQALHYSGTMRESVTFENLEYGRTYYVGEVDEFGGLLDSMQYGDGVYAPEYPDGYEITPVQANPNQDLTFENRFYELPYGYYYGGELTVTKRTLLGTEEYGTDEVFYAALFTDAALTERYGDVIALEMGGESETCVTVPVYIGETADSSATYYVAETDEDGNVLDPEDGLAFQVSIDQAEIVLSPENSNAEAVITNTFPEEYTTEHETTPESGTPPQGGNPSNPGNGTVRTGDETPAGAAAGVMLVSLGVLIGAGYFRRRTGKRR